MRLSVLLIALALAGCVRTGAQVPGPVDRGNVPDPPGRVARLNYVKGPVSFRAAGTDEWVAATVNRPLTNGDELWTGQDARAELDIGQAFVRLDSHTSLAILTLDDRVLQIKVAEGTAQVRLRRLDEEDTFEIATPQAAFSLLRTGEYRIGVAEDGGETIATVRTGQVEAAAPGQAFTVRAGQQARITGAETIAYDIHGAPPLDAFDDFCAARDRRTAGGESARYVSPYVIGSDDLDAYGSWRVDVAYGPCWRPRVVVAGWAPYRFGHWVWIEPWGWTWIDDAPWGFAPFHYGRWAFLEGGWCWIPGPVRIRAVYAPALVVFVGGGPGLRYHFRVGVELGIAWFPLGPREVYIPPYRSSRVYVTNINISHTTVVNTENIWSTDVARQRYMNREVNGAVTAVPEATFINARTVSRDAVAVSPREIANARIGGTAPPVAPTRRSIAQAPEGGPAAPRPPAAAERRQVTVRRTPAPAPVPFERERPVLDRDPGRPPDRRQVDELRRAQPQTGPAYREARPAPRPAEGPAPARSGRPAEPQARQPQPQPQARPPARPQSQPRQAEDRRRTIEQEHSRQQGQPQSRREPAGRQRDR
jgi:hypothetical protein